MQSAVIGLVLEEWYQVPCSALWIRARLRVSAQGECSGRIGECAFWERARAPLPSIVGLGIGLRCGIGWTLGVFGAKAGFRSCFGFGFGYVGFMFGFGLQHR